MFLPLCAMAYQQKDTEGKDRTVFDIPIFTEEFLNHSKGEELEYLQRFVFNIRLLFVFINVSLIFLCRSSIPE